jgi:hypothetical protein
MEELTSDMLIIFREFVVELKDMIAILQSHNKIFTHRNCFLLMSKERTFGGGKMYLCVKFKNYIFEVKANDLEYGIHLDEKVFNVLEKLDSFLEGSCIDIKHHHRLRTNIS